MSQTTCQLLGANTVTDSNFASGTYATASQVGGVRTTGSITSGTAALTVASGSGISNGDSIVGEGIIPGTTVLSGGGTTSLTLSANASVTLTSKPVSFFSSTKVLTPGNAAGQLCRAWVNFDGTGTVAIRASHNVSSITDNGVGSYTVNFTTALADANYCAVLGAGATSAGSTDFNYGNGDFNSVRTTTTLRLYYFTSSGAAFADTANFDVAIFR